MCLIFSTQFLRWFNTCLQGHIPHFVPWFLAGQQSSDPALSYYFDDLGELIYTDKECIGSQDNLMPRLLLYLNAPGMMKSGRMRKSAIPVGKYPQLIYIFTLWSCYMVHLLVLDFMVCMVNSLPSKCNNSVLSHCKKWALSLAERPQSFTFMEHLVYWTWIQWTYRRKKLFCFCLAKIISNSFGGK